MRHMRGDTNFKGSDSSDPTVYSLYCAQVPKRLVLQRITLPVSQNS